MNNINIKNELYKYITKDVVDYVLFDYLKDYFLIEILDANNEKTNYIILTTEDELFLKIYNNNNQITKSIKINETTIVVASSEHVHIRYTLLKDIKKIGINEFIIRIKDIKKTLLIKDFKKKENFIKNITFNKKINNQRQKRRTSKKIDYTHLIKKIFKKCV